MRPPRARAPPVRVCVRGAVPTALARAADVSTRTTPKRQPRVRGFACAGIARQVKEQRAANEARLASFKRVLSAYGGAVPLRVAAAFSAAERGSAAPGATPEAAARARSGSQIASLMALLAAESSPWLARAVAAVLAGVLTAVTPLVVAFPGAVHACGAAVGGAPAGGVSALCPATDVSGGGTACVAALAMSLSSTMWFFYYVFAEFITGIVR